MDRRKFLINASSAFVAASVFEAAGNSSWAKGSIPDIFNLSPDPVITQSNDLTPYSGAWTDTTLRHLLRRTMFGVPMAQFQAAQSLGGMSSVVDTLLTVPASLPSAPSYMDTVVIPQSSDPAVVQSAANLEQAHTNQLINWWMDLIIKENLSIRERMTVFWSNHFVVGSEIVTRAPYLYYYNQMLRTNALGNMKDFVTAVSQNPGMIQYLNSDQNYDGIIPNTNTQGGKHINENYARELCELFTLGLNDPVSGLANYTETDVQQAAKALSGWSYNAFQPDTGVFFPSSHNNDQKTFLGTTGNLGLTEIIDIIFTYKGPNGNNAPGFNAAYWFCRKLYMEFVYYVPNNDVVTAMANLMLQHNFEVIPVLKALFESDHFYDINVINAQLKSPVNFVAGMMREFGLTYTPFDTSAPQKTGSANGVDIYADINPTMTKFTLYIAGVGLGQVLTDPPNVRGWLGGRNWISTGTFDQRQQFSHDALIYPWYYDGSTSANNIKIEFSDPTTWAQNVPNYNMLTSNQIAGALSQHALNRTLGPNETAILYIAFDPSNGMDFYFENKNVATFAILLAQLPEYQLT
jgi:uncharacterized protein (DUF1800 family)